MSFIFFFFFCKILIKKTLSTYNLEFGENPEQAYPYCDADEGSENHWIIIWEGAA